MKPLKNRVTWRSDVDVLLWRYAERWVHLRLWGVFPQNLMRRTLEEDGEEDEEDEGWKEVKGHSTVTWSKLRTLVFTGPTYIALSPAPSLPCFDMPKLTSLTSRGDIKASDLKLLPLQQLVYIALEGDRYGGALKQVLKACTGVKELVVLDVVTYDDDIVIEVEEGVASRNWTPLIHLAQLRVRGMTTFLYVLSSIRFPHLQSLHIDLASEGQQGGFVGTLNMRSNGRGFVAWFLQKRVLGSGCSETLTKLVLSALFGTLGASQQIFEFLVSLTALIHLDLSDELHDVDFLKQLNAEKGVACLEHIRLETLAVVSGSGGDKMKYAFDRFVDERGHWALDGERFASYDWSARIRFAEFVATANDVFDLLS
ncbi:hypothetical protein BKA70DRAFT_439860 [Coprinopsis sp. MPI-PUGE-AT-0042]|nr:hypothetical protein BKA70DRAFT_439860 [Coprinopsis sp. MPI-PUGE-AT-0042]